MPTRKSAAKNVLNLEHIFANVFGVEDDPTDGNYPFCDAVSHENILCVGDLVAIPVACITNWTATYPDPNTQGGTKVHKLRTHHVALFASFSQLI